MPAMLTDSPSSLPDARTATGLKQHQHQHPGLLRWELLTQGACQAQAEHRIEQALAGHVRALWMVESLLGEWVLHTHPDDCLAALVVSHHSLSHLYCQQGQERAAVEHLCAPHELMLRLAGHGSGALQLAAWRHLQRTRAALLEWQHQRGRHPRIDDCVQQQPQGQAGPLAYRH